MKTALSELTGTDSSRPNAGSKSTHITPAWHPIHRYALELSDTFVPSASIELFGEYLFNRNSQRSLSEKNAFAVAGGSGTRCDLTGLAVLDGARRRRAPTWRGARAGADVRCENWPPVRVARLAAFRASAATRNPLHDRRARDSR